jgi:hypothetical protein
MLKRKHPPHCFVAFPASAIHLLQIASMADDTRTDPFKPVEPLIPGIQGGAARNPPSDAAPASTSWPRRETVSKRLLWIVPGALAMCVVGGGFFLWQRGSSSQADPPATVPAVVAIPLAAAGPLKPAAQLPVGPGPVATTAELAKAWAGKRFLFRDPVTSEPVPAMIVHLPDGSYWAFSLREPFGTCNLEYMTELGKLRTNYSFTASHPMVVDTCNRTVYDLLLYGGSSDGGLVRGDIVAGSGIRPPMAIEVRVEGQQLVAVRME